MEYICLTCPREIPNAVFVQEKVILILCIMLLIILLLVILIRYIRRFNTALYISLKELITTIIGALTIYSIMLIEILIY